MTGVPSTTSLASRRTAVQPPADVAYVRGQAVSLNRRLRPRRALNELRPRQGRSPTRLIYRRVGDVYIVLAVAKDKADFEKKKRVAQERGRQYA
jgi:hypothetical protein